MSTVIQNVWDRQSLWSQTAGALRSRVTRTRTVVLALTIIGAGLSTAAATVGLEQDVGKWLAFGAAAATGLAGLGHFFTGSKAIQDWVRARSVSEAIKAEAFPYLARAGDYASGNPDDLLDARVAGFEEDAADLLEETRRHTPEAREPPAVSDVAAYATVRVLGQIDHFYNKNAAGLGRKVRLARSSEIVLSALGALLAAAAGTWGIDDLAVWVPVVGTIAAAITAHAAAERYEFLRLEYSRTAWQLERLMSRWRRSKLTDARFVAECETVISHQNEAWMAKLTEAEQEQPTGGEEVKPTAA